MKRNLFMIFLVFSTSAMSMTCQEGMKLILKEKSEMSTQAFFNAKDLIKKEQKIKKMIHQSKRQLKVYESQKMKPEREKEEARLNNLLKWQNSVANIKESVSKMENDLKFLQEKVSVLCDVRTNRSGVDLLSENIKKYESLSTDVLSKTACLLTTLNRSTNSYNTCESLININGLTAARIYKCDHENYWTFSYLNCLREN